MDVGEGVTRLEAPRGVREVEDKVEEVTNKNLGRLESL
jgi:hypothetical protein